MQHKPHMDHFVGAWRTIKARPVLFLVAPVASLVGLGALIDNLLYSLSYLVDVGAGRDLSMLAGILPPSAIGPTINGLAQNVPLLIVTVAVFLLAFWFQGALLHICYVHGKHRKHARTGTAFRHAARQLWRSLLVHVVAFSAVFLLLLELDWVLNAVNVASALWVEAPIITLGAVLMVFVLTMKMLALHRVSGADRSLTHAVQDAWSMVTRSPIAIIEFNLLLFAINVLAYIILVGAVVWLAVVAYGVGTLAALLGAPALSGVIEVIFFLLSTLALAGCLTAFNMAAWAHLTKTLETRRVGSALRHLSRQYL